MEEVEKLADDQLYIEARNILRIANQAVKEAKEENKRLGIPNTFWRNGKVYYELPNGEITDIRPDILKS